MRDERQRVSDISLTELYKNMPKYAALAVVILFGIAGPSYGQQPIDVIRKSIDQGIRILKDPRYKDADQKKLQRQRLSEILEQTFDFSEFSKRVLAGNRVKFISQQRKEFTGLFAKFINLYYLTRLQDRYNDENIVLRQQEFISHSRAVVKVLVLWRSQEIPVDIKMIRHSEIWKAYDVSALGISAVGFYRAQFNWILQKKSPSQLIEQLKKKIKELEKKDRWD